MKYIYKDTRLTILHPKMGQACGLPSRRISANKIMMQRCFQTQYKCKTWHTRSFKINKINEIFTTWYPVWILPPNIMNWQTKNTRGNLGQAFERTGSEGYTGQNLLWRRQRKDGETSITLVYIYYLQHSTNMTTKYLIQASYGDR